jgi:hypothetical protein
LRDSESGVCEKHAVRELYDRFIGLCQINLVVLVLLEAELVEERRDSVVEEACG